MWGGNSFRQAQERVKGQKSNSTLPGITRERVEKSGVKRKANKEVT